MTVQLSKAQIDAIKVELAKFGLDVRPKATRAKAEDSPLSAWELRELNAQIAKVKAMSFKTAGVKSRLLRNYQHVKQHGYGFRGVTSYQVRGADGQWYGEDHPGFERAKAERKRLDAMPRKACAWDMYADWKAKQEAA